MRHLAIAIALVGSSVAVAQAPADSLDQSLARLVESYTGLYTRETLPQPNATSSAPLIWRPQ